MLHLTKEYSYYENKKKNFINKYICYGHNKDKKWEEVYGNKLAPPYTEKEILIYENNYSIRIPINLRNYLVYISRETISNYGYPYIVNLYEPEKEYLFDNVIRYIQIYENGCHGDSIFICVNDDEYNGSIVTYKDESSIFCVNKV